MGQFVDLLARATVLVCQEKMPDYEVTGTSEQPRTGWGEVGMVGMMAHKKLVDLLVNISVETVFERISSCAIRKREARQC